ncbi:MAG: recombinase RecA, partial [Deltaproteobacteria bacterium]|nr:recombinase RecA [Deltaproteobacteria bacterium]
MTNHQRRGKGMANLVDKERAVDQAISQIEKQFGQGSIM